MLDNLTARLAGIVKHIRGEARITEANIQEALREVRIALLEADVALPVVKHFIDAVRAKALGAEVAGSLTPGQAFVGLVHRSLTALMGDANVPLNLATQPPAVILMAGLQGSGKTTTSGKLARLLVAEKKKVALVSADVYRPAAIEQLKSVAGQVGAEFIASSSSEKPLDIVRRAQEHARTHYQDVLIVDTAGRLAIDEEMMREIAELHAALQPVETLFIVDAISVRHVTGKPIKFAGVGEKLSGLEPFHPERMAARILGMGDIVSLVEEAHARIDLEQAKRVAEKVKKGKGFDLEDFKQQIAQMKKMGGVASLIDKLPAQLAGQVDPAKLADDRQLKRIEGIINSMTPQERSRPELIKASRKRRIAAGAGVPVQAVNQLLNQFEQMQKMMKMMKGGNLQRMMRNLKGVLPGMR